jgi:hypothetical protein
VVPSKKNTGEFVVYKPAIRNAAGVWKTNYEFDNSSELLLYMKELALKAVSEYDVTQVFGDIEDMDIDAELSKAIEGMEGVAS